MPEIPDYPFQRFVAVGDRIHVAPQLTSAATQDTAGFQEVIDHAGAEWDFEEALKTARMGYLLGEGKTRRVVYVADEPLRLWALAEGVELQFEAI